MTDLLSEFNADAARSKVDVVLSETAGGLCYSVGKMADTFLQTSTFDLVLRLIKRSPTAPTVIDLARCRVVSSVELTFIGFVIMQVRFHGGRVSVVGASAVNVRALAMVGFDRLVEMPG